jgi:hypothetical protein
VPLEQSDGAATMMDDLSESVEAGLIWYDRVEQALLGGAVRALTSAIGVALIGAALWLTLLIAGPEALRIAASGTWIALHTVVIVVSALLGIALLYRQPWAVLLLYPAVLLLQLMPVLLARAALTGGDVTAGALGTAVLVEIAVLSALALAVFLPARGA